MTINEKIRARRKELGMSQDALAKKVGYAGRSAISKIESGEREVKWSTVLELSQALKWSTDDIARIAGLVEEDDAEFMGHADIQTTRNIYTHILESRQKNNANAINDYINSRARSSQKK